MKTLCRGRDLLPSQLKHMVADLFRQDLVEPDTMPDDESLMGGANGLDSLDAVELGLCIEESFGVAINGSAETRAAFSSIASLAGFIREHTAETQVRPVRPALARIIRRGVRNAGRRWPLDSAPVAAAQASA